MKQDDNSNKTTVDKDESFKNACAELSANVFEALIDSNNPLVRNAEDVEQIFFGVTQSIVLAYVSYAAFLAKEPQTMRRHLATIVSSVLSVARQLSEGDRGESIVPDLVTPELANEPAAA